MRVSPSLSLWSMCSFQYFFSLNTNIHQTSPPLPKTTRTTKTHKYYILRRSRYSQRTKTKQHEESLQSSWKKPSAYDIENEENAAKLLDELNPKRMLVRCVLKPEGTPAARSSLHNSIIFSTTLMASHEGSLILQAERGGGRAMNYLWSPGQGQCYHG